MDKFITFNIKFLQDVLYQKILKSVDISWSESQNKGAGLIKRERFCETHCILDHTA